MKSDCKMDILGRDCGKTMWGIFEYGIMLRRCRIRISNLRIYTVIGLGCAVARIDLDVDIIEQRDGDG